MQQQNSTKEDFSREYTYNEYIQKEQFASALTDVIKEALDFTTVTQTPFTIVLNVM